MNRKQRVGSLRHFGICFITTKTINNNIIYPDRWKLEDFSRGWMQQ